ncbi:MAG: hypothetical protein V4697_00095 [Patescibacteria group bacterium]
MTPEERSLLERTYKLAEENNEILRKMRRLSRYGTIFKTIYWVVILGLSFGAYYFIQPYVESVSGLYGQVQGNVGTMDNIKSAFSEYFQ